MGFKLKSLEERLEVIKLYESGKSPGYLHLHYHVESINLAYYKRRYDKYGIEGLKRTHVNYSGKFRQRVVRDVMENGLSLERASLKYDLCPSTIAGWCKIARRGGMEALLIFHKQGRPPKIAKSLAKSLAMTERTVQREMSFLRNNGYINKEGSDAKGLWKVLK